MDYNAEFGLAIVCQYITDMRDICSALSVSKAAGPAILGKARPNLSITLTSPPWCPSSSPAALRAAQQRLSNQSFWLEKNGALVGKASLENPGTWPLYHSTRSTWTSAEVKLKFKLFKLAEEAAEATMRVAMRPLVQLQQLRLDLRLPVGVLQQLDGSRLTSLEVSGGETLTHTSTLPWAHLFEELSRMPQLKDVVISSHDRNGDLIGMPPVDDGCNAALATLTQLTKLEFNSNALPAAAHIHLQPQLRQLRLQELPAGASISHLQQLTQLHLDWPCYPGKVAWCPGAELAAAVGSMPQLQHLALRYRDNFLIPDHASMWPRLPRLRELGLDNEYINDYMLLTPLVAAGIAGATALTRLACEFDGADADVQLVPMLAPLRQLQYLELRIDDQNYTPATPQLDAFSSLMRHNMSCLTALELNLAHFGFPGSPVDEVVFGMTNLVQLVLTADLREEEDVAVSKLDRLAIGMPQLQRLALIKCGAKGCEVLRVLKDGLPQLRKLVWVEEGEDDDDDDNYEQNDYGQWLGGSEEAAQDMLHEAREGVAVICIDAKYDVSALYKAAELLNSSAAWDA